MKKYKFEFDYKLRDCFLIMLHCTGVFIGIALLIGFLGGIFSVIPSVSGMGVALISLPLATFFTFIYAIVLIARYIIEGITIVEIE
ncbi:hypothetical protein MWG12_08620 [Fusobacterium necrophorum]|uniref:hypothetical protein n=1 Tax=Fusobacterium necrophorum TaxID=859 RepID=UPI00254D8B57|nr:hypothetical protein [Fusobacterium necrophorum]MDK4472295.1 hypothetical protein [Fusobacterium necrophorum]MDK4479293.1 hypothetical protein [Fusobacterium necrophorum]MDK4517996.1 hypothetical protein [Fusobacterium necrophorum]